MEFEMTKDTVEYIDPFVATDGGGNCLVGPYLPFSLVRLGPDTVRPQPTSGYDYRYPIKHFSHTHVSGTGGSSRYGNIGIMPFYGAPRCEIDPMYMKDEQARCGYYSVILDPAQIRAELTSTPRCGLHRYTFMQEASTDEKFEFQPTDSNILIDIGAVIQRDFRNPLAGSAGSLGGYVEFITENELVGRGDFQGGWGHDFPYSVYFYIRFDQTPVRRFTANNLGLRNATFAVGPNCKAILNFGSNRVISCTVGISFVSVANARASVEKEALESFDTTRNIAVKTWKSHLDKIQIEGGTEEQKTMFYSMFSRLLCMPTDLGIDDEFGLWKSGVRHFSEFYCLWDSVRNANSFLTLIDPKLETDILNCFLDIAGHTGWLPDAWIAGHSAAIQGGSSVDILFCEAYLKGLQGIDYEKALFFMRKNAEVESPDPVLYGRYLPDWRDLGYLSTKVPKNCVSKHIEYAYQDYCIAVLASKLGQQELAAKYFETAKKLWNLWREDIGFFAPRQSDGAWVNPFDPVNIRWDSWNDPYFYESPSMRWSWNTHQDFPELIRKCGGKDGFYNRLENYFNKEWHISKEAFLHVPYLYINIDRPDRAADRVREYLHKDYKPLRKGLADNEDMGSQSTFYLASTIGLYPLMGQDLYWIVPPSFDKIRIELGTPDKVLTIHAPGATAPFTAPRYIKSATLNGKPLKKAIIRHHEIANGGDLHFEISETPTSWGRD